MLTLYELMDRAKITQEQLCEITGIERMQQWRWQNHYVRADGSLMSSKIVGKISFEKLNVNLSDLEDPYYTKKR